MRNTGKLEDYLSQLRAMKCSYSEGMRLAKVLVIENGGVIEDLGNGQTVLALHNEEVICFQPFEDIDLLYWEC